MAENIVILGAGESGCGAALLATAKGFDVFVSDNGAIQDRYKRQLLALAIPFEEGGHSIDRILEATEIIKSPGIPDQLELVQKCVANGIPVISELEFAARYTDAKIIAVTGTNGKTTTTLLTHHILKHCGIKAGLAGNIGHSLAKQVIDDPYDYYVVEVSSFQLDTMFQFRSNIAILLNITKDHLNRYEQDFEKYVKSKFRITQNMTEEDCFIYFADDEVITSEMQRHQLGAARFAISMARHNNPGAFLENEKLHFNIKHPGEDASIEISTEDIALLGPHNMINAMAASLAALLCDVPLHDLVVALGSFKNAAHRLEYLGNIDQVSFVNDSKATNVDAVFYALESYDQPIVWIAGGVDKGNNYQSIRNLVASKVKALICLGTDNAPLLEAFQQVVPKCLEADNMELAVNLAIEESSAGDVVLLSPACASFDLFKNYQQRGDEFRRVIGNKKKVSSDKALLV
ncbi:MAG: UDP-N-acetylmuramoylalanine--D-glutamate ligase [Cyclobacteriaceae bacterium]|nr:MAG: UDP-N-acetylmuramoylalanine--D-glutamate ligase [Cyclobacteriaceae bacterium]